MKNIELCVIDGQNDFCASGKEAEGRRGALFVEKADTEAVNVAEMIKRLADPKVAGGHKIRKIRTTLDSHHRNDGSHHISWKGKDGSIAPPFTIVTHEDVQDQKWVPRFAFGVWEGAAISSYDWALKYTKALKDNGSLNLCLWPVHCQIGTWGNNIYTPLSEAFDEWCEVTMRWIEPITKGHWVWSEHYGAFGADVPDPTRPETQMNVDVVQSLMQADMIAWAGWAGSHCLPATVFGAANHFGKTGANDLLKKSYFFEDASAPVPDIPGAGFKFSDWRKKFLDEVVARGGTVTTTKDFLS